LTRRTILTTAALLAFCLLLSLASGLVALRAAGPEVTSFELGTVETRVEPARSGRFDLYVPIVDWGVRTHPYHAPLAVNLQFRSLDRDAALAAVRSGPAARQNVRQLEEELRESVNHGLRRAAIAMLAGGILGGFFAGALLAAFGRRRRWVAGGAGAGLVSSTVVVFLAALALVNADWSALRQPTFYAHGSELPELLSFSDQILTAGETYTDSYDRAVAGLENLIAVADRRNSPRAAVKTAVLASDLHSNGLVLPALAEYTKGRPVFFVGDFGELGTRYEEHIIPDVARLGTPVVAVSGNHDTRAFMKALERAGVIVLTRSSGVVDVDGWTVAGFQDPLEGDGGIAGRRLKLRAGGFVSARQELVSWFDRLPRRPEIVLVHQHGLAHALLDHVAAQKGVPPLLILTGHDHRQHLDRGRDDILVDGGTVGAGGPFAIGEAPAGFALLHLTGAGRLQAVDLVQVEPLSGEGSARRVVIDPAR
jgi:calcineurin-like phosphoesterase family protein